MNINRRIYEYAEKISARLGMEDVELNTNEDVFDFISKHEKEYIRIKKMDSLIDKADQFSDKIGKRLTANFLDLVLTFSHSNKGIYMFYRGEDVVYVGKSFCLSDRVFSSLLEKLDKGYKIDGIFVINIENDSDINIAEPYIISKTSPEINKEFATNDYPELFYCKTLNELLENSEPIPLFY